MFKLLARPDIAKGLHSNRLLGAELLQKLLDLPGTRDTVQVVGFTFYIAEHDIVEDFFARIGGRIHGRCYGACEDNQVALLVSASYEGHWMRSTLTSSTPKDERVALAAHV